MEFDEKYPRIPSNVAPWLRRIFLNEWNDFKNPPRGKIVSMQCGKCNAVTEHQVKHYTAAERKECHNCGTQTYYSRKES